MGDAPYPGRMPSTPSRRSLLAAGLALFAAGVAGCTKAVKAIATTTSNAPTAAPITAPTTAPGGGAPGSTTVSAASTPATSTTDVTPPATVTPSGTTAATTTRTSARTSNRTTASRPHTGPAVEVMTGPTSKPQVALTFHGAGDLSLATAILQIVKDRKARITVMAIGTWLQDNPQMAKTILAGGHELGNHTYQHLDINSLPADQITSEIVRCRDVLTKLTGSPGAYFRQSQAQHASDQVKTLAGAAGYATCLSYDLDSMDYTDPGGPAVRSALKAAVPGAIVSMHLGHQSTVDALPGVLDDLRSRGLAPVTVSTLLAG